MGKKQRQEEVAQNGLRAPLEVIREDELYDTDFNAAHNIKLDRALKPSLFNLSQNYKFGKHISCSTDVLGLSLPLLRTGTHLIQDIAS